ncbi:FecR domain-containing protein [Pseudomonas rubra]|uniref:FecR domain-containing protein n=1 Tax=Pseudomonas rubra TaxID=2942627 RepID=A0ABT5PA87_9PSED|nr:FecR domain-containing protein [Pseudomonas rubra]MDD1015097.1 FecR domain-containing protein [Pseudomonas rubra]MDD1038568.1 FecR domain-containing protein [Pseudomonas rubra]MDD1154740.1 FecR domain-containing protein [Pseudomonas rubra]
MTDRERQRLALKAAARWHVQLAAGDAPADLQQAWHAWLASAAEHRWAWERVEQLQGRLASVPGALAFDTLQRSDSDGLPRRSVLKGLLLATGLGFGGWASYRSQSAQHWLADVRSATGEIRHLSLADGSLLVLDTASAADICFDRQQRLIRLRHGRLFLTSAKDSQQRPLRVETSQGVIEALGTRFSVDQRAAGSQVEVFEHAVRINPYQAPARRLEAGQRCQFDSHGVHAPQRLMASESAWTGGHLIVEDWRLGDLLDELGRYRPGLLAYASELNGLRVSGTFSLTDSDAALSALATSFKLQVRRYNRYWVSIDLS